MFETTIIVFSILFSAFFSGTEIAYISINRMQAELERKKNNYLSKIFIFLFDRPEKFISTLLLGNTICLVVYGYYFGDILTLWIVKYLNIQQYNGLILVLQTLISTFIILITGEYLPKAIFSSNPYKFFKFFLIPSYIIYFLLSPIIFITNGLINIILKLFNKSNTEEKSIIFKEEMSYFISEKMDEIDEEKVDSEVQIFKNALHFSELKARDCMIPRKEIVAYELNDPIDLVKQKFIDAGFSKIIIYKDSIDHIIGYVHTFDFFKKPKFIRNILLPVEMIHETTSANKVMNLLIKKKRSVAIVIDEYGGTAGMLTLEDIVEELFGDIEDEHDKPKLIERKNSATEYEFSARLEIDYLNQEYDFELPESDGYETLGGFIVSHLENIPKENEEFFINQIKFIITKVSNTKIEEVKMILN